MLVLTRKVDERIVIGDGLVEIVVCDIRGDRVRLGIIAPRHVDVHREEIYRLIKRHQKESVRPGG